MDVLSAYQVWQARVDALVPENKARLLAALLSVGITQVQVNFDGSGDSGQLEDIQAYVGGEPTDLPAIPVHLLELIYGRENPNPVTYGLAEAIESMCYALLTETHDGWENSDGAYGEFTFDVEEGTIALDYNERYTSSENYGHIW